MRRRDLLKSVSILAAAASPAMALAAPSRRRKPNFVLILCDDLGYGDLGPYGGKIKTPAIDKMAREGLCLMDYYVPANLCTPSRAGILTGRYPIRTGLGFEVIMVNDKRGLPLTETTIAKALKPDYVSALIGKWHLGHTAPSWPPTNHGFDLFYGIPYSHDMKPLAMFEARAGSQDVLQSEASIPRLQQDFTARAEQFISDNRDRPFFLELALSAPHLQNEPAAGFKGTSNAGAYGDVVREIDTIVDRILKRLKTLELDRDTLVILTSDNGPWFEGSAGILRDRKGGAAWDGGYRVPFIARWPGAVPANRKVASMAMGIDLLPTFCSLAGLPAPSTQIDGLDITAVLKTGAASPHDQLVLFDNENVVGIRTQRWKLVSNTYYRGMRLPMDAMGYTELYDMVEDPSESYSVDENHPEVAADMRARLKAATKAFAPMRQTTPPAMASKG